MTEPYLIPAQMGADLERINRERDEKLAPLKHRYNPDCWCDWCQEVEIAPRKQR